MIMDIFGYIFAGALLLSFGFIIILAIGFLLWELFDLLVWIGTGLVKAARWIFK